MLKTEPKEFQYVHRANGHICHCYSKVTNGFNKFLKIKCQWSKLNESSVECKKIYFEIVS